MRRASFHPGRLLRPIEGMPVWRTLAGYPGSSGSNDGPGIAARFTNPSGIVVDSAGTVYVADSGNHVIRTISPAGVVGTLAGQPGIAEWRDGSATNALFSSPGSLALAPDGTLFVADVGNDVVRQISPVGVVSTVAGQPGFSGYRDGVGTNALFGYVNGLARDTNGNLYVSDSGTMIRRISPAGQVTTFAGQAGLYGNQDGQGTNAQFNGAGALAADSKGNLHVADSGNVIRRISPEGMVTTWVGGGAYRDGQGTNAGLVGIAALCVDSRDTLYITEHGCVRMVTLEGEVSTLGGISQDPQEGPGEHVDGPAPFARFWGLAGIAVDPSGRWLVTDSGAHTIRCGSLGAEGQARLVRQPVSQIAQAGANTIFRFEVQQNMPHTCQWLVNGQIIPGATNDELVLENVKASDAGEYRAAVFGGLGYVLSFPAALEVQTPPAMSTAPLDNWQPLASLSLQQLIGIAYGNDRFVAVGGGGDWTTLKGVVATSTDGEHWLNQPRITSETLKSVAFGNGRFVAVGAKATVLTSTDGLTWTPQVLTTDGRPNLNGVAFAQELFVAVSGDTQGSIWTSADGVQWTNRGADFGLSLMAVRFQGDEFIAVGNTIMVSTNGLDWAPANVPTNYMGMNVLLEHIAYGQGKFLSSEHRSGGGGRLLASSNSLDWVDATPTNELCLGEVAFGNGRFVAVDANSSGLTTSEDGQTWTTPTFLTNVDHTAYQPDLCFEAGLFLATGDSGALFTSTNGTSWSARQPQRGLLVQPAALVQAGGRYFGASGPGIETSTNGSDWTLIEGTNGFNCLAYGDGALVAIGSGDTVNGETVLTSSDGGTTWIDRSPHLPLGGWASSPSRVAYGAGTFVAVGSLNHYTNGNSYWKGRILVSSDAGATWTGSSPTWPVTDVAFGNGLFVALRQTSQYGAANEIITSTNGLNWKSARTFSTNALWTVACGNGRFVIGGDNAMVVTSTDGIQWETHCVPGVGYLSPIVYGNGVFLAITSTGLCNSVDGLSWSRLAGPEAGASYSIFAVEGRFLAIDGDSNVYASGPFERLKNPHWLSGSDLQWTITGAGPVTGRVEFSEDLLNWQTLLRFTNAPARQTFTDPGAASRPRRFYRVVTE